MRIRNTDLRAACLRVLVLATVTVAPIYRGPLLTFAQDSDVTITATCRSITIYDIDKVAPQYVELFLNGEEVDFPSSRDSVVEVPWPSELLNDPGDNEFRLILIVGPEKLSHRDTFDCDPDHGSWATPTPRDSHFPLPDPTQTGVRTLPSPSWPRETPLGEIPPGTSPPPQGPTAAIHPVSTPSVTSTATQELVSEVNRIIEIHESGFDQIDAELAKLDPGWGALSSPDSMIVGQEYRVTFRLTHQSTPPVELRTPVAGGSTPTLEPVRVSPFMRSRLAGHEFSIQAQSDEDQPVGESGYTEWSWLVVPKSSGLTGRHISSSNTAVGLTITREGCRWASLADNAGWRPPTTR